jgi:hypothetical protein
MATGHDQPGCRVATLQARDLLARFSIRLRRYRAGIKHHEVRLCGIGRHLMPKLHELIGPGLQLGFVKPATERLEIDIHFIDLKLFDLKKLRGF